MGWEQYLPTICWALILVLALITEGLTMGLTSVWFAVGALVALLSTIVTDNIVVQIIVFLAVSLLSLLVIRPLARRSSEQQRTATNADRVIGAEGIVGVEIDNLRAQGQVSVSGAVWSARSADESIIPVGTKVRILRIEGVKLIVMPSTVPAPAANEE